MKLSNHVIGKCVFMVVFFTVAFARFIVAAQTEPLTQDETFSQSQVVECRDDFLKLFRNELNSKTSGKYKFYEQMLNSDANDSNVLTMRKFHTPISDEPLKVFSQTKKAIANKDFDAALKYHENAVKMLKQNEGPFVARIVYRIGILASLEKYDQALSELRALYPNADSAEEKIWTMMTTSALLMRAKRFDEAAWASVVAFMFVIHYIEGGDDIGSVARQKRLDEMYIIYVGCLEKCERALLAAGCMKSYWMIREESIRQKAKSRDLSVTIPIIEKASGILRSAAQIKIKLSDKQPPIFTKDETEPDVYRVSFDCNLTMTLLDSNEKVIVETTMQ
jgi:tetratricopeptide (TPR) repeat protein